MRRTCAVYLLLGLVGPLAGCQLISRENLEAPATTGTRPSSPSTAELPPKATAEVCRVTAEALEKDGKEAEAIALYEKARQNGSQKPQVSRRLAVLYDQKGDFKRALEEYKQLLKHNPKDADLLNDVGYCYYNQGNWVEAEKYLRQAVAANPKHARGWINLGMTLAQTNRTADSLEAFAKVVSPAQAQCNLAFILTTQSKLDDAKAAYRQALALDPDLGLARGALAKLEKAATPSTPARLPDLASPNVEVVPQIVEEQTPIEVSLP